MGWSDLGEGCFEGDGPADAIREGLSRAVDEVRRRTGKLPSGTALLEAFVAALNLDGARAPFYSERHRIEALVVRKDGKRVRVRAVSEPPWMVGELYAMLDEIAEEYVNVWERPPHLREFLHHLRYHFEDPEARAALVRGTTEWSLRDAKFVFREERKSADRAAPPALCTERATRARERVKHPKFGNGVIVEQVGDRVTVDFHGERRVLLRSFLTPID